MIEYLLAPPVAIATGFSSVLSLCLFVILIFCVIVFIGSLLERELVIGIISFVALLLFGFIFESGIYKSYDPLPKYTKETCVLVYDGAYPIKPYKSTTTYAVGMKTYKNTKNDETFTILASHGIVYPKEIVCYRVEK